MDPTAITEPSSSTAQSNGEKRALANGGDEELLGANKRPRCGDEALKRVAEIVLVLSTMASMRGGRKPTEAEVELMAEARGKLVEMCGNLSPKDIVPQEAIGKVIEDLGLNTSARDQRLGFSGTRMSIAEKVDLSKRKMEDSKKFVGRTATYTSQPLQANVGATVDNRGALPRVPVTVPYTSGPLPASSGVYAPAVPAYQMTTSEMKTSMPSGGFPSNHLGRESFSSALPRVERPQFKAEGGTNGAFYSSQVRASSPANFSLVSAPSWSVQPHPASSAKPAVENKRATPNSVRVETTNGINMYNMSSQAARDQTIRPFIAQNAPGSLPSIHQSLPGMNFVQPSATYNHHTEIAKIVQNLLQPTRPEHPPWTPPSRDYMHKPLTCQICKITTNEVGTVLVCDACDKGYHIKCINHNGLPRSEWHCQRCLTLSNGKPLPPKYGRVTRNTNPPKAPSNSAGSHSSQEHKVTTSDPKISQQKITANGNSGLQNRTDTSAVGINHVESVYDSKISNARETQINNVSSVKNDEQHNLCKSAPDKSVESSGLGSGPTFGSSGVRSISDDQTLPLTTQEKMSPSEMKLECPVNVVSPASSCPQDQTQMHNSAEVSSNKNPESNSTSKPPGDSSAKENLDSIERYVIERDDGASEQANIGLSNTEGSGPSNCSRLSSDGVQTFEWIGDVLHVADGKKIYQSCCINGVAYKVHDHALFRFSCERLIPSKLQGMWEDIKTGSKWFVVRKCYFPSDLPEIVGRPYTSESNEVFESTQDTTVMASLVQSPCEVLTAAKFEEESERRRLSGTGANSGLKPFFLRKWFYDEVKGTFLPASS